MDKSQTKFLLGIVTGGVAIGAGYFAYDQLKASADKSDGSKMDARYISCNAASANSASTAFKGDDGKQYKGDAKATLPTEYTKSDGKFVKYDGKIFKTDGKTYDASPLVSGEAKAFKNDDGKYLYTDGKDPVKITTTATSLVKYDGKIYGKEDKALAVSGPVYVYQDKKVVCTTDGRAIPMDVANDAVTVLQLNPVSVTSVTSPAATPTPATPLTPTMPSTVR